MDERPDSLMRALARAILQEDDQGACAACLDQLEGYATLQLDGGDYMVALPAVAAHLDGCVACSQSYALLYNVLLAERAGALPTPTAVPQPDLGFLPARRALGELLREAAQQLGARLRVRLSQQLLDMLRPPEQPALAFRDGEGAPLFSLELPAPSVVVERLAVAIYPAERDADRCLVQVSVALPGRAWPDLGGVAVHLSGPGVDQRATTDPWGEAAFDEVPRAALPSMVIEVAA